MERQSELSRLLDAVDIGRLDALREARLTVTRLETRLAAIDARAAEFPAEVVERVRGDVSGRIAREQGIRDRLVTAAQAELERLDRFDAAATEEDTGWRLAVDELRLRRAIGDIDEAELVSRRAVLDQQRDEWRVLVQAAAAARRRFEVEVERVGQIG